MENVHGISQNCLQYALFSFQLSVSDEKMYIDAWTIDRVPRERVDEFNFVAGLVPGLQELIKIVSFILYRVFPIYSWPDQNKFTTIFCCDLLIQVHCTISESESLK